MSERLQQTEAALLDALDQQRRTRAENAEHDTKAESIPEPRVNGVLQRTSPEWRAWYHEHDRLLARLVEAGKSVGNHLREWEEARR